jgi:DNA/RNA endonuclease G (NUC1)
VLRVTYQVTEDVASTRQVSERAFKTDPTTLGPQSMTAEYKGTGYDQGHMAQREAFAGYREAEEAADLMTNVVPQTPASNRGAGSTWRAAERRVVDLAADRGEPITVVIEPHYDPIPPRLPNGAPIPFEFRRIHIAPDGTVLDDTIHPN